MKICRSAIYYIGNFQSALAARRINMSTPPPPPPCRPASELKYREAGEGREKFLSNADTHGKYFMIAYLNNNARWSPLVLAQTAVTTFFRLSVKSKKNPPKILQLYKSANAVLAHTQRTADQCVYVFLHTHTLRQTERHRHRRMWGDG